VQVGHPEIDPNICDTRSMKNSMSLNGVKPKATALNRCDAKECGKLGGLRSYVDSRKHCTWAYYLCDEHFGLFSEADKRAIARSEGTKSK
jgi:hypothetical protein